MSNANFSTPATHFANRPTVHIRPARPEDAEFIIEYCQQLALETEPRPLDAANMRQGVEQGLTQPDKCLFFVAEVDGRVVGQAMITYEWGDWRNGDFWWFQSVYVHPDYRRQGVFKTLFRHIQSLAHKDKKTKGLRIHVEASNTVGETVYRRLGFHPTENRIFESRFLSPLPQ
ncbi:MAG: GNAT family N-acetyltransferase [Nitrospinaceae bacterium]|nr:GNAT family N-acetyltransferase [Nitrospinaceae bacterium]NIR57226.1 GNAT family N-acetyltransferase [Nitrospinaceae bacterium]NIS87674.1 GNAT family N-acetyltransferase [Nitrospinaceae bacterium]NIT84540.1 GNAT family N-acetyltransferase [Nitrospinaceae bacterium]NIU46726.1 GNAT family N-acetyltransferase [Nitrospinaceae bacterium]